MMIETRYDQARGCGWRKPGGLYLVAGGLALGCTRLPAPLERCPTCDHGIKPARGWTWVSARGLTSDGECLDPRPPYCPCPWWRADRCGLLWVGERFYATAEDFTEEAARLGISRRIHQIPHDFEIGKTWVLFAHRHVMGLGNQPGIFHAFQPTAIEYVVTGTETEADLTRLVLRGITPVKIERKEAHA